MDNEMRAFKNRGFHDGYDAGKSATLQAAFDSGYKKAFEQNFILSTLKGVASALKTSYNESTTTNTSASAASAARAKNTNATNTNTTTTASNNNNNNLHKQRHRHSYHLTSRPNSAISSASTPSTDSSFAGSPTSTKRRHHHHHHHHRRSQPHAQMDRRTSTPLKGLAGGGLLGRGGGGNDNCGADCDCEGADNASTCSSSSTPSTTGSSSGPASMGATGFGASSGVGGGGGGNNVRVNISSNQLSLLDSMKFDGSTDIESLKKDLIAICRENRLEILAHYVSQIG